MTRCVQKAKPVGVQPKLQQQKSNYLAIYTNKTKTLTKQKNEQNNQLATPNKNEYN